MHAEFTANRALQIYNADPGNEDWLLRFSIVEVLNFCEVIAIAYVHQAADRNMIRLALEHPLTTWHRILKPFLETTVAQCGVNPWEPFTELVEIHMAAKAKIKGSRRLPL